MRGIEGTIGAQIRTRVGAYFDLADPWRSDVVLADIAHALGNLCRFTGHTRRFYSVAEHSVHCSWLVPPEDAAAALMHDAVEAYVGDVSRPLRTLLPGFRAIEAEVEARVLQAFEIPLPLPESVGRADLMMLKREARFVMECSDVWPGLEDVPLPERALECWSPEEAGHRFLMRAMELGVEVR